MKNRLVTIMGMAAVAIVFSIPLMMGDAAAQTLPNCNSDSGACPDGSSGTSGPTYCNINGSNYFLCGSGSGGGANPTPEMSDYLAVAFVLAAGTMLYYIRKRSQPAA